MIRSMSWLRRSVERQWYTRPDWLWLFLPFNWLFVLLATIRRFNQRRNAYQAPLPVIVIGNISVGGTGKTPTIISLANALKQSGHNPVIISRGYGSSDTSIRRLPEKASPAEYGDEPVMIVEATGCPVVVGADRVAVARHVAENKLGDVILSDDGLQHYRLARTWEIAVIDGKRRIGNGWRLPVGPLRESPARLRQVDTVLINGTSFSAAWLLPDRSFAIDLQPMGWRHVRSGRTIAISELNTQNASALAGIGNPQRFFDTLRKLGFTGVTHEFADHHAFTAEELRPFADKRLLMTEKDAVKVRPFAAEDWWALIVEAPIPTVLLDRLTQVLQNFQPAASGQVSSDRAESERAS